MQNIEYIRNNSQEFDLKLAKREIAKQSENILSLDLQVRKHKAKLQELQQQKNYIAKNIGQKKSKGEDASQLFKQAEEVKQSIHTLENNNIEYEQLDKLLNSLPNLLDNDVPKGKTEEDNIEIRRWGEIKDFLYKPLAHYEIGEKLKLMDFQQAGQVSGARFVILKGALAQLERALSQFALDILIGEYGYQEISPPLLVTEHSLYGSGQLPKFAEDCFQTTDNRWLIPTAEVSLVNLMQKKTIKEAELPLRFCAYTPCFRSEAGAAGKDTRGMIRMHQFYKVEMVSIAHPNESKKEHEKMTKIAETMFQKLQIPYRVVLLCAGDTGFCANKTYDIEVWLPGQNQYREISSCSNCGDFQARRMKAKFKTKDGNIEFLHTLNGTGLAIGRALIAILENYQNEDGSVTIPEILRKYMNNAQNII